MPVPSLCVPAKSCTISPALTTMCTLAAMPRPISRGPTMTLAKLNGRSKAAEAATVQRTLGSRAPAYCTKVHLGNRIRPARVTAIQ